MIAPLDAIEKAISTSTDTAVLDDLARLVWRGLSEGEIDEDDAEGLFEQIAACRPQRVQIDGSLDGFAGSIMGSITPISSLETVSNPRGNVCTELSISERARRLAPHGFQADRRDSGSHTPSYAIRGNESFSHPERGGAEPITAPPGPRSLSSSDVDHGLNACRGEALQKDQTKETSHSTGYARGKNRQVFSLEADRGHTRSKSKRPLKRGPPGSTRLTWPQVKEIEDFAHIARSAGMPLNRMVTIRAPTGVSDADGKQSIRQIVSLAQLGDDLFGLVAFLRHWVLLIVKRHTSRWTSSKGVDQERTKLKGEAEAIACMATGSNDFDVLIRQRVVVEDAGIVCRKVEQRRALASRQN